LAAIGARGAFAEGVRAQQAHSPSAGIDAYEAIWGPVISMPGTSWVGGDEGTICRGRLAYETLGSERTHSMAVNFALV